MDEFTVVRDANSKYVRYGVLHNGQFAGLGPLDDAESACDSLATGYLHWSDLISHPVLVVSPDGKSVLMDDFEE